MWAVPTTFTLNEQADLEIEYSSLLRLQLQADISHPGNTLRLELFIDADKNGKIEHDIDADFSALMGKLQVTDGGKDEDIQVLSNQYVIKIWLKPICLFFARDKVNDHRKD